ncbi:MAG: CheR family methyltransferase, partial [Deltaproteobacteria bacterium]|nr:CheR family methyltransferase [Deltaproteobacteria bacterium]
MTPLAAIAELLRVRIGLDVDAIGTRALGLAVRRRARARGIDGLDAYRTLLAGDANEWQALIEAVVVPESWFFRDGEPFALLGRWASTARRPGTRLTLLSLPCASGEEPWSMAIALAAAGLPPEAFHIDALDLSERALAVARQGIYPTRALRSKPVPEAWHAYLHPLPERRFEVDAALRASLRFAVGNLVDVSRTLAERHYDAIFSRNLLIYCDATTRAAALASFATALRPDGLLVLGHADPLPPGTPGFVRVGPPAAFAWRRAAAPLRP